MILKLNDLSLLDITLKKLAHICLLLFFMESFNVIMFGKHFYFKFINT